MISLRPECPYPGSTAQSGFSSRHSSVVLSQDVFNHDFQDILLILKPKHWRGITIHSPKTNTVLADVIRKNPKKIESWGLPLNCQAGQAHFLTPGRTGLGFDEEGSTYPQMVNIWTVHSSRRDMFIEFSPWNCGRELLFISTNAFFKLSILEEMVLLFPIATYSICQEK